MVLASSNSHVLYLCFNLFLLKGSSKRGSPPCCPVQKRIPALSFINIYLPDNLPDWACPGNWLGHADLQSPVEDPSLCNLCSFPLKLFNNEAAETVSSLNVFHLLTILYEKKCCLRSADNTFYVTSESVLLFFHYDWIQRMWNLTVDKPWIIL